MCLATWQLFNPRVNRQHNKKALMLTIIVKLLQSFIVTQTGHKDRQVAARQTDRHTHSQASDRHANRQTETPETYEWTDQGTDICVDEQRDRHTVKDI